MGLPNAYLLAGDSELRLLTGYSYPPKAGRVKAIEGSGQLRVELDDADGGDVLAWPLNGFTYGVDDLVYVLFAANAPDSAIVVGARSLAPARLETSAVRARSASGLRLEDDGGNLGVFVEDGGQVGVGTSAPAYALHLRAAAPAVLRVTGHKDGGSFADGEVIGELHFDAEDADAPGSTVDANVVLRAIARSVQQSGNKQSDLAILVKPFSGNYDQADIEVARFTYQGRFGIGVTSPQGILHTHDGVGGMLHWSHSAVGATAVTIIPDGAGDVVWGILFLLVIESGGARGADLFQVNNGASVNVPVGGGAWTFAVSTAGALTVQRTAGSGTARITLLGCWL